MLARLRTSPREKDQGFTLIELLVVMVIIGILAAIAIPTFIGQKKKAIDAGMKSDLSAVAQQIEANAVETSSYPTSSGWYDLANPGSPVTYKQSSPETQIWYKAPANSTSFCLASANSKGTADGTTVGSKYFIWDSAAGGLKGPADSSANCSK